MTTSIHPKQTKEIRRVRSHFGSSGPSGSSGLVLFHLDHGLCFFSLSVPCLLPCSHSVSRSRPRSRRHLPMTRHTACLQMFQFLTSRLMHKRRRFSHTGCHRTNAFDVKNLPSRWSRRQQWLRRHGACLPIPTHLLRLLREMSARQSEQLAHLTSSVASMQGQFAQTNR